SYLFPLGVFLIAMTGMAVFVILRRLDWANRVSRPMPLVMTALVLAMPSYFGRPTHRPPQLLRGLIQRLKPFQEIVASPKTVFLKGEYPDDVRNYPGRGAGKSSSYSLLDEWSAAMPLDSFLEKRGVNLFYIDEALMERLSRHANIAAPFLNTAGNARWEL